MDVIAVIAQKGGTGKTTTAAALAHAAACKGCKVLAIDLDPQGNLSLITGADMSKPNSYDFMNGAPAAEVIQTAGNIDIIPASWNLAAITSERGSARRLQKALEQIRSKYDYIFIDTPPTAGELQYNAMQAATGLVIPLQADIFAIQCLYQITDTAKQIQRSNPQLHITGFILTRHSARSTIARQMQETITANAAAMGVPYLGAIRAAVAVQEAQALQQSLFEYAPKSNPAKDYTTLFERIQVTNVTL